MVNNLDAALEYIARGWPVLPVWSKGKRPVGWEVTNGVHGASLLKDKIKGWFEHTDHNVAIACGKKAGIFVIDIDDNKMKGKHGSETIKKLCSTFGKLPPTVEASTPSGGRHLLFTYPDGVSIGGSLSPLGGDVDILSDGRYFNAYPSLHPNGHQYEWAAGRGPGEIQIAEIPVKWLEALKCQNKGKSDSLKSDYNPNLEINNNTLGEGEIATIQSALDAIPPDDRDTWLRVGMSLKAQYSEVEAFSLWDNWSVESDKYDSVDQLRTWKSIKPTGGISTGTLFGIAEEFGWVRGLASQLSTNKISEILNTIPEAKKMLKPPTTTNKIFIPYIINEITEYINRTAPRPQPILALNAAISLAAIVCGRKYRSENKLRPNIYTIGVGQTGCGKDHGRKMIRKILADVARTDLLGGEELASGAGLVARMAKKPNTSLFQLDEFGMLLSRINDKNSAGHEKAILSTLMKFFSSADDIYLGAEYANQGDRPRVKIEYPCCGVHATTTPETFWGAMDSGHVVSGFLNRFIVVDSGDSRPDMVGRVNSEPTPWNIQNWIELAGKFSPQVGGEVSPYNAGNPVTVPKTPAVRVMFTKLDRMLTIKMQDTRKGSIDSVWSRTWEHADKLALIGAVAHNVNNPVVTEEIAQWAIDYAVDSSELIAFRLSSTVADSPFESTCKRVYGILRRKGKEGIKESLLYRLNPLSSMPTKQAHQVLASLVSREQAVAVNNVRGKKSPRWYGLDPKDEDC